MANSIKEYTAGFNTDGTTYTISSSSLFTTPTYLEGRGETDIKVHVNDVAKVLNLDYIFVNTGAIAFASDRLPESGDVVKITRSTNQDSRLTNYENGSMLKADVLDADANQMFNMAQEALDKAEQTKLGTQNIYYRQDTPPTDIKSGTLWFDTGSAPNALMVYNGTEWHSTAPVVEEKHYTSTHSGYVAQQNATPPQDWFLIPKLTAEREVYLNGVKLQGKLQGDTTTTQSERVQMFNDGLIDYYTFSVNPNDPEEYVIVAGTFTSNDVLTVKTSHGGYATTVTAAEANVTAIEQNIITTSADATALAANYAGAAEDVAFTDDGVSVYSAKHYAAKSEEHKQTTDGLITGFDAHVETKKTEAEGAITTKTNTEEDRLEAVGEHQLAIMADQYVSLGSDLHTINVAVNQGESSLNSLASNNALYAEGDVDTPFIINGQAQYSAKHYAKVAEDAANVSVDKLAGWTTLDSETITTYGTDDPEIISTTSFAITAPEGVTVNDIPLPVMGGCYNVAATGSVWTGSSSITLTEAAGNGVELAFSSSFNSVDDYQVMVSISGQTGCIVDVTKHTDKIALSVVSTNGASVNSGEVAVLIYKFT